MTTKAFLLFPRRPKKVAGGLILPAENNRSQVILIGRGNDIPAIDGDEFLSYARELPTLTVYNANRNAKLLTEIASFSFLESRWRLTVALREADLLFDLLRTLDGNPLATLAPTFLTKAETLIADPWAMSAIPDFIYPETTCCSSSARASA